MDGVTKVQVGCVIIVEGVRGDRPMQADEAILAWIEHDFLRHVRGGH